jgi:hypothetical protein
MLPNPTGKGYQDDETLAAELRRQSMARILKLPNTTAELFRLAELAPSAWMVGHALSEQVPTLDQMWKWHETFLESQQVTARQAADGLVAGLSRLLGEGLHQAMVERVRDAGWPIESSIQVLLSCGANEKLWSLLDGLPEDIRNAYWKRISWFNVRGNGGEVSLAIPRLIAAGRASVALRAIAGCQQGISADLIVTTLREVVVQSNNESDDDRDASHFGYSVEQAFERLDKDGSVSEEDMGLLEWQFVQVLDAERRPPTILPARMAKDPKFFVEVIKAIYRPDEGSGVPEPTPEEMEAASRIAQQAYRVLDAMTVLPGADGKRVDGEVLKNWVSQVRELAASVGRTYTAESAIGRLFAHAPSDVDGTWPIREVRDVIETLPVNSISGPLHAERFNMQGVTMRSYLEGGTIEANWAAVYRRWAGAVSGKWPRTAQILLAIALQYEREARREDEQAEMRSW